MKICDICEYGKKSKIKAGEGLEVGKYRFFTSSSEVNKFVNQKQFTDPGIIMGTGGNATLHYCDEPFSVSTDCLVLFPKNKNKISAKYLYYYLKGNFHVLQAGFRGAGLKHTSKKYINDIKISNIPSKKNQELIIETLDKLEKINLLREHQLQEYDQLIKSRFVEMFETLDMSEKHNNWEPLEKLCKIYTGTTPSSSDEENWDGNILWITPAEIDSNSFYIYDTERKLTEKGRKSKSLLE